MTTPRRTFLSACLALVAAPFVRRKKPKPVWGEAQWRQVDEYMKLAAKIRDEPHYITLRMQHLSLHQKSELLRHLSDAALRNA